MGGLKYLYWALSFWVRWIGNRFLHLYRIFVLYEKWAFLVLFFFFTQIFQGHSTELCMNAKNF